ncbi:MAG: zinc ribbon domain-containing protein [Nitrospirota bacterium]
MPIYEYRCNKCSEEFEKLVFSNTAVCCPKCSSDKVIKKMSLFGMGGSSKNNSSSSGSSSSCSTCTSANCSSCH